MTTHPAIPEMPEGLTPDWLNEILTASGFLPSGVRLRAVTLEPVGEGTGMMSELARVHLDYEAAPEARTSLDALPATVVAKFASRNPTNREVAMAYKLYEREVRYFAELEPISTAQSPTIFFSAIEGTHFLILMEDMAGYRVGDQTAGADLADTERLIDELAKLHAAFWDRVDALDWVPRIAGSYHATNMATLIRSGWDNMASLFHDYLPPAIAERGEAFIAALPSWQAAMNQAPVTLLHGDFRLENVFFGTAPEHRTVAIIDWQGPLVGRAMVDVALLLGQSTQTAVRRRHEAALIERYVTALERLGVTGYEPEQAHSDYERALLYNWVYVGVVAGALDVSDARSFAWMAQMVARQSAVSEELDVFRHLDAT